MALDTACAAADLDQLLADDEAKGLVNGLTMGSLDGGTLRG